MTTMVLGGLGMLLFLGGALFLIRRGGGAGLPNFRPGTKAWEASLELPLMGNLVEAREQEMATASEPRKARLVREIAFLKEQRAPLEQSIAAGDLSPGKGYIGVKNLPADP